MPPTAPKDPLLGRTIAQRYRLISRLGAGSVASVYLARHVLIERLGAIKIVHPELARDPVWRERFLREARAVNRINHPNIVEITDLGEADGLLFLVMEYVPGESLKQLLERGPLGWRRAAALGIQVASALGRAHQMGVVHRGLDTSNILVVPRRDGGELVKLTDFGVAKLADAAPLTVRADAPIDFTGLSELDARSDLFALGAILYEATSGNLVSMGGPRPPRTPGLSTAAEASVAEASVVEASAAESIGDGGAGSEAFHEGDSDPPPPALRLPDTPAFFDEVLSTLLAPDTDHRPRDGFEAADLLRRALERDATPASIPPGTQQAAWWPLLEAGAHALPSYPPVALSDGPPSTDPPSGEPPRQGDSVRPGASAVSGAAVDRLAALCASALAYLEERIDAAGRDLDAEAFAALREARKVCTTVAAVSELCASDTRALETVQARGRGARAELGRRLDEAAREHSRALGWAGTIAERSYLVEAQRLSGEHPVPAIEAMVWEQAALEQEEDRAREKAARLAAEMRACQAEIERYVERLEHEVVVVVACLEGRMGALRALSIEAWVALEHAAARAGVPPPPRR